LASLLAGGVAAACGGVLAVRRLVGAVHAAGPDALLATCGIGLLLVAVADLAGSRTALRHPVAVGVPIAPLLARTGLVLAMAAVALPLRLTPALDALLGLAAVAATVVACLRSPAGGRWFRSRSDAGGGHHSPVAVSPRAAPPGGIAPPGGPALSGGESPGAGTLSQRFERLTLPDGSERIQGRVCVAVPEGARSGSAHVGFCPPLAALPTIDISTDYDGVEAVVSAAEVLPWGVRIECRLSEPADEPLEIPVDVLATAAA